MLMLDLDTQTYYLWNDVALGAARIQEPTHLPDLLVALGNWTSHSKKVKHELVKALYSLGRPPKAQHYSS